MTSRSSTTRRLWTLPLLYLGLVATWVAAPLLMAVAALVDGVRWIIHRTPFMATRLVLFLIGYLTAEAAGVATLAVGWLAAGFGHSRRRMVDNAFAIQKRWAGFVFWMVRRLFRLSIDAEGTEVVTRAPFILIARHTSIVDNLLPSHFISRPHGIHVRYVMKDELLMDPALDIAGNRLPNHFVRRGVGEGDRETRAIRQVARTMGPDEAVLIYPEGTRFSADKRDRALRRLERTTPDLHRRASRWESVLPPRLGGTLALLDGCDADVVVLAHRGLDGFARVADIWRGAMVGRRLDVRFHRIDRSDVPTERTARAEWLYDVWEDLDRWVTRIEGRAVGTEGSA